MAVEELSRTDAPVAACHPQPRQHHGDPGVDNYYWLRDRTDPEVIRYLQAENAYVAATMADTEPLQKKLYGEMRGRIQETDTSVPVQIDHYLYYTRTEAGKQYTIHCRKSANTDADEEILLDENQLASDQSYLRIGGLAVSPDHRLMAYLVDISGGEKFGVRIKDLESGRLSPDEIPNAYYGLGWGNDSRTLFYTVVDAAMRPYRLMRHRVGCDRTGDALVLEEGDDRFFLAVSKSRSKAYLLVSLRSKVTSEVHTIPADRPHDPPRVIQPRVHGMEYSVEHHEERFFVLTNHEAVNFRVMETLVDTPSMDHWRDLVPHDPVVKRDEIHAFAGHLVVYEREQALRQIRVLDLADGGSHRITFAEPVYTVQSGDTPNFDTTTFRYVYSSLTTPRSIYDYDMPQKRAQLRKQDAIKGYDPGRFVTERQWATAGDGTRIPISLVYLKGLSRNGESPLLLYAYGSYGMSIEPSFQANRVSLLERGIVFAIAHVRGGGEMGRPWYEDGKFLHKKNTFSDFVSCAEHLIRTGHTRPDRLVISGRSAGGLLVGAVVNLRPDLFQGAIAGVPFVDVLNTMLDPSIPLTVVEYEEWGNPNDPVFYQYIKSYAPYENVTTQAYPHMLVTAGLNDPRVQYWEPAKWVAKLRHMKRDGNRLLLKTNMGAGHSGSSGRYDVLKEVALEYAFLLEVLGMADSSGG